MVEMYQFCYNSYTSFGIHSSVIKKKEGGKKASSSKKRSFRIHFIHVSCLLDSLAAFLRPRFLQFSDVDRDFSRTDATVEQRSIHACHCLD